MVLLVKNVHAECGYETQAKLNSEAATIKAIYEEKFVNWIRHIDVMMEKLNVKGIVI